MPFTIVDGILSINLSNNRSESAPLFILIGEELVKHIFTISSQYGVTKIKRLDERASSTDFKNAILIKEKYGDKYFQGEDGIVLLCCSFRLYLYSKNPGLNMFQTLLDPETGTVKCQKLY